MTSKAPRRAVVLGWLGVGSVYFYGLGAPDAYLSIEEVQHARQAYSLATTGRGVMGEWLPMYFSQPDFLPGRDPIWIYTSAALLKLFHFSEALIRAPSTTAGLINIALVYLIVRRIFDSWRLGFAAAIILALTPSHFLQSRIATSQIAPVLCVLLWMHFLLRYQERLARRDLIISVASLGIGIYTYLPALFVMPVLWAATFVALAAASPGAGYDEPQTRKVGLSDRALVCIVFAATFVPWLLWHGVHPERFQLLRDYYSANGYNTSQTQLFSLAGLLHRADLLWNAFNPGMLFFSGDANLRFSTRNVGHFLLPAAVLLTIALGRGLRDIPFFTRTLVVAGLLVSPVPAVLAGDYEIKRWLVILPFIVIAATAGLRALLGWSRTPMLAAVSVLAIVAGLQFVSFLIDYHGGYRARSMPWFGGNMKAAISEIVSANPPAGCVLIDRRLYPDYWPLYASVMGRRDLAQVTNLVDVADPEFRPPAGCSTTHLIVSSEIVRENSIARGKLSTSEWTSHAMAEPGGTEFLRVYKYSASRSTYPGEVPRQ